MNKISRLELCREALKRIIYNLIEVSPFKGNGRCRYCNGINEHQNDCVYETAQLTTRKVRANKKKGAGNGPF